MTLLGWVVDNVNLTIILELELAGICQLCNPCLPFFGPIGLFLQLLHLPLHLLDHLKFFKHSVLFILLPETFFLYLSSGPSPSCTGPHQVAGVTFGCGY